MPKTLNKTIAFMIPFDMLLKRNVRTFVQLSSGFATYVVSALYPQTTTTTITAYILQLKAVVFASRTFWKSFHQPWSCEQTDLFSIVDWFNLFLLFVNKVNHHHHRLASDSKLANERIPVAYSVSDHSQVKQLLGPTERTPEPCRSQGAGLLHACPLHSSIWFLHRTRLCMILSDSRV